MGYTSYIAKVWLKEPMSMPSIAIALNLHNVKLDQAHDRFTGNSEEDSKREFTVRVSWGSWDAAEKIKVYAEPPMLDADADLAEEHMMRVLGGKMSASPSI